MVAANSPTNVDITAVYASEHRSQVNQAISYFKISMQNRFKSSIKLLS